LILPDNSSQQATVRRPSLDHLITCLEGSIGVKKTVLGVDLGGTHMRIAAVDQSGQMLHQLREMTLIQAGAAPTAARLVEGCRTLMDRVASSGGQVVAVGLGVAGKIDRLRGTVLFSPNLPAMDGYPLAAELQGELKLPVRLENDANAFGLGEHWTGKGQGIANWIGLTLGTGVGGCLILENRLWQGDDLGCVAEIGHMIIDPHGPRCNCGAQGCLEAHASASALRQGVHQAVLDGKLNAGPLFDCWQAGHIDAAAVYRCAQQGDALAQNLFDRMGWALGLGLTSLFTVLGMQHAIIGGGVSASWDAFIGALKKSLAEHCTMISARDVSLQRSCLGDDAALLGAAHLAWQHGG
jgi:glucokinase